MSNVAYWRPKKTSLMPHLPLAETSFESPSAGSETAEQQQESCPTCLPSTAPRMSNVAYWRPKKTSLMPHLPLAETSFEKSIGWLRNGRTAQRPVCLTLRADALKKQVLCHIYPLQKPALKVHRLVPKRPNSAAPRMSNVAYWRPKKTNLCHIYPLQKPALRVHRLVPKRPNSSRNRAQHAFPAQRPKCLTLRTDALKNQVLCHIYTPCRNQLWESIGWFRNGRTAQRPECLTLRADALKKQVLCHIYPLQKPALRVHRLVPKRPNSSRNRAQHAFPAQRPICLTLRTDALKKQVLCHIYPLQKPALRVHRLVPKRPNSSRNRAQHAFPAQRPECLTLRTDALKKQVLCHIYPLQKPAWESIGWFRNGRTAAGIVPNMPSQHSAPNV